MTEKTQLRNWAKKIRQHKDFRELDKIIVAKLKKSFVYNSSQNLMLYYPTKHEINILQLLKEDKNFCFPRIINNEIVPYCNGEKFCTGKFNIQEPFNTLEQNRKNLDIVIVPALCVDIKGNRLGYGKGYYDRFIKTLDRKKTKLITPIYDNLVVSKIDTNEFDEKIDIIVTEKRIITL